MARPNAKYGKHNDKAIVVSCPKCKAEPDKFCIRSDGKNGRIHIERVLKWEREKKLVTKT